MERVAKQLDALTADERTAAVLSDAPELASLIAELTAALDEVCHTHTRARARAQRAHTCENAATSRVHAGGKMLVCVCACV